jgi:hypothetical protein
MNELHRGALIGGILFVAAGIIFLLEALEAFDLEPEVLWPGLLIALGVAIAFGGRSRPGG